MTLVDVCCRCGTMFEEGEDHCRRCGSDRRDAERRELRDLCYTYTGDEPEEDEIARMVKPAFIPKWGKPQWYEMKGGRPDDEGDDGTGDDDEVAEGEDEDEA